jgi:hypothetical protein
MDLIPRREEPRNPYRGSVEEVLEATGEARWDGFVTGTVLGLTLATGLGIVCWDLMSPTACNVFHVVGNLWGSL